MSVLGRWAVVEQGSDYIVYQATGPRSTDNIPTAGYDNAIAVGDAAPESVGGRLHNTDTASAYPSNEAGFVLRNGTNIFGYFMSPLPAHLVIVATDQNPSTGDVFAVCLRRLNGQLKGRG